jgi:predicted nucleic acid-binding protein
VTYLLDTNVLSETRKRQPAGGVTDWIASTPADRMHVSVLTIGEIEQGTRESAAEATSTVIDALIAATARVHGMTVDPQYQGLRAGRSPGAQPLHRLICVVPARPVLGAGCL